MSAARACVILFAFADFTWMTGSLRITTLARDSK